MTFECDICRSTFLYKSMLDQHLYTYHKLDNKKDKAAKEAQNAIIKCMNCNIVFPSEAAYNQHVTLVHTKQNPSLSMKSKSNQITDNELADFIKLTKAQRDPVKVRYDILVPEFLEALAQIAHYGAEKYGEFN